jgi:hypothetical protein
MAAPKRVYKWVAMWFNKDRTDWRSGREDRMHWKWLPMQVPTDGDVCVIRLVCGRVNFTGTWRVAGTLWDVEGLTSIPWYMVECWKKVL